MKTKPKKINLAEFNASLAAEQAAKEAALAKAEKAAAKAVRTAEKAAKAEAEAEARKAAEDAEARWSSKGFTIVHFENEPVYPTRMFARVDGVPVAYCHQIQGLVYAVKLDSQDDFACYEDAETFFLHDKKVQQMPLDAACGVWMQQGRGAEPFDGLVERLIQDGKTGWGIVGNPNGETVADELARRKPKRELLTGGEWVRTRSGCYWKEDSPSSGRNRSYGGHKD